MYEWQERVKKVEETALWKGWERNIREKREGDKCMKGTNERKTRLRD
jgi:hypothetical protein